jgi:hypothetical protein
MKRVVALWSLLVMMPITASSHAGEVVFRETETGIYVEMTGEPEKGGGRVQVVEQQAAAQPAPAIQAEDPDDQSSGKDAERRAQRKAAEQLRRKALSEARAAQAEEEE